MKEDSERSVSHNTAILLSVVVPAYNEERRLPETLRQIFEYLDQQSFAAEVIIADDGSSDSTARLAREIGAQRPELNLLALDHRGKGYAVRAGALAARGRFVLLCDADMAVPMAEWERLRAALEHGAHVAIGSREGIGATREGEPGYRHLMGRIFNLIIRVVAIGGFQDTQCGFKALYRSVSEDLFRRVQIYGDNAPTVQGAAVTAYDVELLYLAVKRGYHVAEIPVLWRYGEETKVSALRDSWRNLRDVLRVRWNALRGSYRDLKAPLAPIEASANGHRSPAKFRTPVR
jgi:dolichyl-phosphate beta-glucosyltransferase